jgi:hypothetical protein
MTCADKKKESGAPTNYGKHGAGDTRTRRSARGAGGRIRAGGNDSGMSVLFALVASLCAAVVAVLFVTMWLDGDGVTTTALAVALLPVLVLAMMAWGEAL